jgi:threonine dehydratase
MKVNSHLNTTDFSLPKLKEANQRIRDIGIRHTPLLSLDIPGVPGEIFAKLENLQITGSFKVRGSGNVMYGYSKNDLKAGVWTASAGNMALGVAWHAQNLGIPCTVVVPSDAPEGKIKAVKYLHGKVIQVDRETYWEIQKTHAWEGIEGLFIHPFADPRVIAGNSSIAFEILDDLPDVDTIITPYGGGGLSCGVGAMVKALNKKIRVIASETENGAPLTPSLKKGEPVSVPYKKSFISGMGSSQVFEEMWPLAKEFLHDAAVASLAETAESIKLMAEYGNVVCEGAGATSIAVALQLSKEMDLGKTVCVISGGNIDRGDFIAALSGKIP